MKTPGQLSFAAMVILIVAQGCGRQNDTGGSGTARTTEENTPANQQGWFEDVTERAGVQFVHEVQISGQYLFSEWMGSGAAFFDFNNDGRLDLYLIHNVNPSARVSNRLYEQQTDGRFRDVSAGSGLDVTGYGNGVAVGDVNNDGLPEVLVTEYDRIRLFLNEGNGKFTDVTAAAGLTNDQWSIPAAFFDYDRDGWLDLVVGNYLDFDPTQKCFDAKGQQDFCGPHGFHSTITRLYHNLGARSAPSRLTLSPKGERKASRPSLPRFEDVTVASGFARAPGKAMQIVCVDFDGDGFPDVFITDDALPNRLFMNQRDGTFKEEAMQRGVAYTGNGSAPANMGIAMGDIDGDGLFDLFVPHLTEENHTLWRQRPRGMFQDDTARSGLLQMPWHGTGFAAVFADFDCDGALDLAVANGRIRRAPSPPARFAGSKFKVQSSKLGDQTAPLPGPLPRAEREKRPAPDQSSSQATPSPPTLSPKGEREKNAEFWKAYAEQNQLFANDGSGHFREVSSGNAAFCGDALVGRGLVCGDIDNDGAPDLLLTGVAGPARLFRNVASGRGHWLGIRAIIPALGGRDAYGTEIVVEAGGRRWWRLVQPSYGYASSNDPRVQVGLGAVDKVDSIRVRWPDGAEESFSGGPADRYLILRQGSGQAKR